MSKPISDKLKKDIMISIIPFIGSYYHNDRVELNGMLLSDGISDSIVSEGFRKTFELSVRSIQSLYQKKIDFEITKRNEEYQSRREVKPVKGDDIDINIKSKPSDSKDVTVSPIDEKENAFYKSGDFWNISYQGNALPPMRDLKGFHYLEYLLNHPNNQILTIHLYVAINGADPPEFEKYQKKDKGENEDHKNRIMQEGLSYENAYIYEEKNLRQINDYKKQYQELMEKKEGAEDFHNSEQLDNIKEQLTFIAVELAKLTHTYIKSSHSENCRRSISKAIKRAYNKISPHNADLESYLLRSVIMGSHFCYTPDPSRSIRWNC